MQCKLFSNGKLDDVKNTIKLAFKRILEAGFLLSSHSWSTKLLHRNSLPPAKRKTTLFPSHILSAPAYMQVTRPGNVGDMGVCNK